MSALPSEPDRPTADASRAPRGPSLVREYAPLALAILLGSPLALHFTPARLPVPVWLGDLALALLALALVLRTRPDASARRQVTLRAGAIRSALGLVLVPLPIAAYVALGRLDTLYREPWFVLSAAAFGAAFGPVALFVAEAARRAAGRRDAAAALLAGWASFALLCVGCVQANHLLVRWAGVEVRRVLHEDVATVGVFAAAPLWTLVHFGCTIGAVAAVTFARLRGWMLPRQLALGLACAGAFDLAGPLLSALREALSGAGLDHPTLPPGEPVVVVALATTPLALALAARVADRLSGAAEATDPQRATERSSPVGRVATALVLLTLVAFLGRTVQQELRGRALAREVHASVPGWLAALSEVDEAQLRAEVSALESDAAPAASPAEWAAIGSRVAAALARLDQLDASLEPPRRAMWELEWTASSAGQRLRRLDDAVHASCIALLDLQARHAARAPARASAAPPGGR